MAYDLVVRNGEVIDGTGKMAFKADVAVEGDKITAIGSNLGIGKREVDASEKVVSPGFIDAHTHMDLFLLLYPEGKPVVNYGVTTIVIGDCGASIAPVPPKSEPLQVLVKYLRRVLDDYVDEKYWKWKTFPEYLGYLKGRVGINVAALVPHSPVRLTVMGEAAYQREANSSELDAMKKMIRESLEAGAIGFSSSPRGGPQIHSGTPSTFASRNEIVELANVAADFDGTFQFNGFYNMVKPESGFPEMLDNIRCRRMIGNEFRIRAGEKDNVPLAFAFMEESARRGKDVNGVVIPYQHDRRFGIDDCIIFQGLPTWEEIKNGENGVRGQLSDRKIRARLERERIEGVGRPVFPEWLGWERVIVETVTRDNLKFMEGKNIVEIARITETSPRDVFFDTWIQDDFQTRFKVGFANMHKDLLREMVKSPVGLIGTDTGAHLLSFFFHGSPARVLGHWCRELNLFTLEEAVWKVTGHSATKLGLNRGYLKEGLPADITIFDPDKIQDLATEKLPESVDEKEVNRHPPGIHAVVVNGDVVLEGGIFGQTFPGKVTRQELCYPGRIG